MTSNFELIGREDVNDLEAILSVSNTDVNEVEHAVRSNAEAIFTWNYERSRPALSKLYEKAKVSQWNATTDLDWSITVDQAEVARQNQLQNNLGIHSDLDLRGTVFEPWTEDDWIRFGMESQNWTLSQFLHGEQGALMCTARIVETVPWIDAKYYASTQVVDEARHVEVFSRYLNEKLNGHYPINAHLRMLIDDTLSDSRWDMTYLGMQIMIEGLALAAFGFIHQMTTEPLLKQLLRYVMSDEARHVAFGVISLKEFYAELNAQELRERMEFAFEAAVRMRDRFIQQEVWERMGLDPRDVAPFIMSVPDRPIFQAMLFSKIVPNCRKLGLLDNDRDPWLREKFTEIGVIAFENETTTDEEYGAFDVVGAQ
ncbi:MAG: ferritin-like domain-containing protein [Acidimicrobiia bacterium]